MDELERGLAVLLTMPTLKPRCLAFGESLNPSGSQAARLEGGVRIVQTCEAVLRTGCCMFSAQDSRQSHPLSLNSENHNMLSIFNLLNRPLRRYKK